MSEVGESPTPQEVKPENKVVHNVKHAIRGAWESTKETNREYWEIRKELQERLAWHGGGVYKMYVENMDKITEMIWGKGDQGLSHKFLEMNDKVWTRLKGTGIAAGAASLDIIYNAASWPVRLFLPIPKDLFKRVAIGSVMGRVGGRVAIAGAVGAEMGISRGAKAVGEAAVTAPETVAIMAKRRVDRIIENIKKPKVQEAKLA